MKAKVEMYKRGFMGKRHYYSLALIPETPEEAKILEELFENQVVWVQPSKTTVHDHLKNVHWWGKK